MIYRCLPLSVLMLAVIALPALADQPFSFNSTPGMLPKTAAPRRYQVQITPDLTDLTTRGSETVDVDVLIPTQTLVCNIRNMAVTSATVDGRAAVADDDDRAETVTVRAGQMLDKGPHTLGLAFAGHIIAQPQGLYYIKYKDPDGAAKTMLGTQMEATDARRMFPCWDEPVFRATYQLSVTLPQDFKAVSNMPIASENLEAGGVKTVTFQPTPPMASYLMALVAGDLEAITGKTADGIPVRVVTTRGKKATGEYALSVIEKLLPFYDRYFGVKFPLPKMDLIAVPGGFPGAMENWGAVVYDESTVLYDPAQSSPGQKEEVFHVIAHETAHQWFGDLVTMAWWDDIWLNEGFASWMDLKATDHFNPDWQVWLRAGDDKYSAMDMDARLSTHPIQQHLTDPAQIDQAFDDITYNKGASVIRMVETYLGPDTFQKGIQAYVAAHEYSSTTTADLWDALAQASGKPVAQVAGGFTAQPGFPLVTAQVTCQGGQQRLSLSQSRFLLDGVAPSQQWQVPIAFGGLRIHGAGDFLLTDTAMTLAAGACGTLVVVNAGNVGYYRVKYVGPLWDAVEKAAPTLAPADQVALLDDRWALTKAGQTPATDYLRLAQTLQGGVNLAVWQQVLGVLEAINRLEADDPARPAFQAYAIRLVHPLATRLGRAPQPGDDETTALLRTRVITALGAFGDPDTLAWARTQFATFTQNPNILMPSLRRPVFNIVGHYADQQTYDRLHLLADQASSFEEKQRYYDAMASAQDPKLAQQTLDLSLTADLPAPFNAFLVRGVAFDGEQPGLAWDFARQHAKEWNAQLGAQFAIDAVPSLFEAFSDTSRADELIAYSKTNLPPDAQPAVDKAVSRIQSLAALKQRELPRIDDWVQQQKTVGE